LVPFARRPEAARPSQELLRMLGRIARQPGTDLVLVSGRPKDTMAAWFTDPALHIVVEHGAWIKRAPRGEWKLTRPLRSDWKQSVLPILREAADRLPGAFVEEKDYSVVWHYRQAEPELAVARAQELADTLMQLTANLDLVVVPGHRNVEVRDVRVSKAQAALEFVRDQDFVLAIGDDATDEDMFRALPPTAYSIRVGVVATHARFNVPGYEDVVDLLTRLGREPRAGLPAAEGPRKASLT
jgi:trehalose 6-phosphate synthase/phosphatase